ncbi:MAG TPA: polyhydroxyalkanoate synthesis repressor PhaR, partial [Pseudoxanthomonas sp.]|nr:polyhydroxyalkanoate synthesis repressor PhaR [Pseudoxanthomonas sp.]
LFMEQQQQFRQQMGGMLGQTPWTMMNQLTERNLELWQEFQRNLSGGGLSRPEAKPQTAPPRDTPKTRTR